MGERGGDFERREPRVDIGITARGQSPYLAEAIESVLAQTVSDWRLTISENGPGGDGVAHAVAPYLADERIRRVTTGAFISGAANHTNVLRLATAPYVAILHDDDRWDADWLERRLAFFERHPECAFVYAGTRVIDLEGREYARDYVESFPPGVHYPPDYVRGLLDNIGKPMPPTVLLRREACEAVGPVFDERFPAILEEMWIRLAARYPVGHIAVWDSQFRVHPGQETYREHWGDARPAYWKHVQAILARDVPNLGWSQRDWSRRFSRAFLSASLDAAIRAERRGALARLGRAVRHDPRAAASPIALATVTGVVGGAAAGPLLGRIRVRKRRRYHVGGKYGID